MTTFTEADVEIADAAFLAEQINAFEGAVFGAPARLRAIRAALRALTTGRRILPREPSEAMQVAGHNVRNDPITGMPRHCGVDEIYTAMWDAYLGEKKDG